MATRSCPRHTPSSCIRRTHSLSVKNHGFIRAHKVTCQAGRFRSFREDLRHGQTRLNGGRNPRWQGPRAQGEGFRLARHGAGDQEPQAVDSSCGSRYRRAQRPPQTPQTDEHSIDVAGTTRLRPSTRTTSTPQDHIALSNIGRRPSVPSHDGISYLPAVSSAAPMSYREYREYRDHPHAQHRPLIDLIPAYHNDVDASDEEDDFYSKEDDHLIHPKWQALITQTSNRVPRKLQRCVVIGLAIALIYLTTWKAYFGPRRAAQLQEIKDMDETPAMSYGSNVRPEFKGMIQVRDMDSQHLPKKGHRLVFVGDVHGCREELEHLLKRSSSTRSTTISS